MEDTLQLRGVGLLPREMASHLIMETKSLLEHANTEPLREMVLRNLINEVQSHYNDVLTSVRNEAFRLQTQNTLLQTQNTLLQKNQDHLSDEVAGVKQQIRDDATVQEKQTNEVQSHYNDALTSVQNEAFRLQTQNTLLQTEKTLLQKNHDHLSDEVARLKQQIRDDATVQEKQRNEVQSHYNNVFQRQITLLQENSDLYDEVARLEQQIRDDATVQEKQTIGQLSEALNKVIMGAPPVPHAAYRGSTTRAKNWLAQSRLPTTQLNKDTPSLASLHHRHEIDVALVQGLMGLSTDNEHDIKYPEVISHLAQIFAPQEELGLGTTHVLDTHERRFLNELAPDITIQRNTRSADKFNTVAVIDLKGVASGSAGKLGTPNNLGQISDYMMEMVTCQPGRRVFIGMLTDLRHGIILKYTIGATQGHHRRPSQLPGSYSGHLSQYRQTSLGIALAHLYHELTDETANPPHLPFTLGAGELVHVLQRHSNAVVAVYQHQGVKRIVKAAARLPSAGAISAEIEFLQRLQGPSKPYSIPELVHVHDPPIPNLPEFGIVPAGEPIHLELFKTPAEFCACLEDILDALRWVHHHDLVHRDVRTDNIVVFRNWTDDPLDPWKSRYRGLLIDFDRATAVGKACYYEGGYISCPLELLEEGQKLCAEWSVRGFSVGSADFDRESTMDMDSDGWEPESALSTILYLPLKAHDYLAFVVLVNTLLFPFSLRWYTYNRVVKINSPENKRLVQLWDGLRRSQAWSGMVELAEAEETDITKWRKCLEMIVWL